jgi:hypothetical protein
MLTYADVCSSDVIHRMQVPDSYGARLPGDAAKILGKEMAQLLKKKEARDCDAFFASLEVADALQVG